MDPLPKLSIRSEPPEAAWLDARLEDLLTRLVGVFDHLRGECGTLAPACIEIIVAEDVAMTVRSLNSSVIGVEDLKDYAVERIGGSVAGKTLFRNEEHTEAVIVLDADAFRSLEPVAQVAQIMIAAHELAHALLGQLRAAGGKPMSPCFLPWETSRWLARYALEEYSADVLAEAVVRVSGTATDLDGSTRPLSSIDFGERAPSFAAAAQAAFEGLVSIIDDYRNGKCDLEQMWLTVQSQTGEILIMLAHAQAEADQTAEPREAVTASIAEPASPLHRLWRSMHELALRRPLLTEPEDFVEREQEALSQAGVAIVQCWAALGLEFTAHGDGYHIAVAHPMSAWPLNQNFVND